jgi:hypothetical protein
MANFEYLILVRDKAGRWHEQDAGATRPVDLEAMVGPFLSAGATQLNAALLLNGYGLQGWEMVLGDCQGEDELRHVVLKRPRRAAGGDREEPAGAGIRRGAALLKGAAVGTLAIGLARLLMSDGARDSE